MSNEYMIIIIFESVKIPRFVVMNCVNYITDLFDQTN